MVQVRLKRLWIGQKVGDAEYEKSLKNMTCWPDASDLLFLGGLDATLLKSK